MASLCLSASAAAASAVVISAPSRPTTALMPSTSCCSANILSFGCSLSPMPFSSSMQIPAMRRGGSRRSMVVCMAPDEERLTRRSPLDFPVEYERPRPGRRPDILPKFSPMKTPLPTPFPSDPPQHDEEEEENEEEEQQQEEEQQEEDPDNPEEL